MLFPFVKIMEKYEGVFIPEHEKRLTSKDLGPVAQTNNVVS